MDKTKEHVSAMQIVDLTDEELANWQARFVEDSKLDVASLQPLRQAVAQLTRQLRLRHMDDNPLEPRVQLYKPAILVNDEYSTLPQSRAISPFDLKESSKDLILPRLKSGGASVYQSMSNNLDGAGTFITATNLVENTCKSSLAKLAHNEPLQSLGESVLKKVLNLPNDVQVDNIARSTLARRDLPPAIKKRLAVHINAHETSQVITHLAWWFLLDSSQLKTSNEEKESSKLDLFTQVSESFVEVASQIRLIERDEFIKYYPDVVAEATFAAMLAAFPASGSQTSDMRQLISDQVHYWMTGIWPYERKWTKWHTTYNVMPSSAKSSSSTSLSSVRLDNAGTSTSAASLASVAHTELSSSLKSEEDTFGALNSARLKNNVLSHHVGLAFPVTRIRFDIHSNSPIVSHYFKTRNIRRNNAKVSLIHFSKVDRDSLEQTTRPTYRDIIQESARKSQRAARKHQNIQETINKERAKIVNELVSALKVEDREFIKCSLKSSDVKEQCTSLLGWDQPVHDASMDPRKQANTIRMRNSRKAISTSENVRVYRHLKVSSVD